jgi:chromosome segregation ATPase
MNHDLNMYSKHTARQMRELETLDSSLDSMQRVHEEISRQLDTTLENVQAKINEVTGNNATAADKERDKNYHLAEIVNGQVTQLTEQLRSVVEKLNTDQEKRVGSETTIEHIEQIVDRHLRSLELIDRKTEDIAQSLGATQQISYEALQSRRS